MAELKIIDNYDNVPWKEVVQVLLSYAYALIDTNSIVTDSKKELAYDFAMSAITSYLEDKEKFDPSRNPDLIKYLKYNILKQSIFNYKKSSKNTKEIREEEPEKSNKNSEDLGDFFTNNFDIDDTIDIESVVELIEKEIENDDELLEIFIGRYEMDSKRSEICKDIGITTIEYNNRVRRLRRKVKKILNSYQEFKLTK